MSGRERLVCRNTSAPGPYCILKRKVICDYGKPQADGTVLFRLWLHQLEHVASRIFCRAEEKRASGSVQCAEERFPKMMSTS